MLLHLALDRDQAVYVLHELAPFCVELAEEPVTGLDDLARVRRRVAVPIAADESIRDVDDARRARALDAVDAVVLKVQPLGGVLAALRVADAAGVPAIVTSMMETSVGLAAGLALACALPELRCLQVPEELAELPALLSDSGLFRRMRTSGEDRQRTEMVRSGFFRSIART